MTNAPAEKNVDRLPWLEPFGESERARARTPVSRTMLVGLLVAFIGLALVAAFLLGYRVAAPAPPAAPAGAPDRSIKVAGGELPVVELPVVKQPGPTEPADGPADEPPVVPLLQARPAEPKPVTATAPAAGSQARPERIAKTRPASVKLRSAPRQVVQPRRAAHRVARPPKVAVARRPINWPPPPSAGPSGQVIQLGAFYTPRQADRAWRAYIKRFPYLATRPKVVVPTPPRKGKRRLYRLQLGTVSQPQSVGLCEYLRANRGNCVVVYR